MVLGFRAKIFLLTLPIVFFADLAVVGTYIFMDRREQLKQRIASGSIYSQNFNKQLLPLMKTKNYAVLSSFIDNLAGMKDVLYATVQDPEGNIVVKSEHFFMEKKNIKNIYSSDIYALRKYFNPSSNTWVDEIHIPLFEGTVQHGSIQIGYAHALLTGAAMIMIKIGLITGGAVILLSLPLSFLTSSILTIPIRKFIKDIKIIGTGNLSHKVNIPTRDEIGRLATEFNNLTTSLTNTLELFARYVPKEVVKSVLSRMDDDSMFRGEKRPVSVFNLDIRNFTPLSEKSTPEEVVAILNKFFSSSSKIIVNNNGIVDKFLGDGILAVFGIPAPIENHALAAIKAALEIRNSLDGFNAWLMEKKGQVIAIGVGINSGEVVAGNIGSTEKMEYTVVGDTVNTAFRIQDFTKEPPNTILMSEKTLALDGVKDKVKVKSWGKKQMKGKAIELELFEVLGLSS